MYITADNGNSSDREIHSPGGERSALTEKLHESRFAVYKMLSLAYLYPGDIDWDTFIGELPGVLAEAADVLPLDITAEIAILSNSQDLEQKCCEHTMLFINNPNTDPIVPYESMYLEDTIMGRCARAVREQYDQYGLAVDEHHSYLLPDHIALELDFMAFLIEKGIQSGLSSLNEQNMFFNAHPGQWMRRFLADVKAINANPYFTTLATVADKFIQYEKRFFSSLKEEK